MCRWIWVGDAPTLFDQLQLLLAIEHPFPYVGANGALIHYTQFAPHVDRAGGVMNEGPYSSGSGALVVCSAASTCLTCSRAFSKVTPDLSKTWPASPASSRSTPSSMCSVPI